MHGNGCLVIPQQILETGRRLERLGEIHRDARSDFWVNVESFTWERDVNSRTSALLPCAFPRYLSQIVNASKAGASKVVSFSIYGIMDTPLSTRPIGQPQEAISFYRDYDQWRRGEGRWPLLEATFRGDVTHGAIGRPVVNADGTASDMLADGKLAVGDCQHEAWTDFGDGNMECVIDMGESVPVSSVAARFMQYRPSSVSLPVDFIVQFSDDGVNYKVAASSPLVKSSNDIHDAWIDIAQCTLEGQSARYIKVTATRCDGRILCDEILINPKY